MIVLKNTDKKIDIVMQVSDIHIRLTKRHDEYTTVFDRFYLALDRLSKNAAGICVITGDVFHNKSDLSPECVKIGGDFLKGCADRMPTILIAGNHDCYSEDHELLTQSGWVNIKKYVENKSMDKIATFNVDTKEIEFQSPSETIIKRSDGAMYNFLGKKTDILVTPTHQMLYYHTQTDKFYKKEAKDVPLTGLIPINGIVNNYAESPFFKLLGFSFAEGTFVLRDHVNNTDENKFDGCRVQFHLKCEREITYLENILKKLNYTTKTRPQKDGSVFIVVYESLAKDICKFFNNKKEIPPSIFSHTNSELKSFMDGYLHGDGSLSKNGKNYWYFTSISKESIDILYTIARLIGASSTKSDRIIFGNYENSKQQYSGHINLTDTVNNTSIKEIRKVRYDGNVYCVSVPNTNVLTRRNGLISICGNCMLSNKNRLDCLTPIVDALNHPNLYYLKPTDIFRYENILFNHFSVFDAPDKYIKYDNIPAKYRLETDHHIALFHGPVNNAITDVGYTVSNRAITNDLFDGHHIVMLGDIHKHQVLQEYDDGEGKPVIVYAGSMIQQNHGEELKGHGFLAWDLKRRLFKHYELSNDYGFYTVEISKGELLTDISNIPKKARIRTKCFETIPSQVKEVINTIKTKCEILESTFIRIDEYDTQASKIGQVLDIHSIFDADYQNTLIEDNLLAKKVDPELIEKVKQLNKTINTQIPKDKTPKNIRWKPKTFEFDNMFSYGEDNFIDFTQLKGTIGLFAPNASGKSSIMDALAFCVFDKFSKGYKAVNVMNTQKMSFSCKFNFEVSGVDYFIERKGAADKKGNVKVEVKFYKIENGNEIPLNGEARRSTNDIIRDYVGTYEDFILTVLSVQNSKAGSFVDLGQTERKDLLCQFMGLTVFDQLYNIANDNFRDTNTLLKNISKDQLVEELEHISGSIEINTAKIVDSNKQMADLEIKKEEWNGKLLELSNNITKADSFAHDITVLESDKIEFDKKIATTQNDISDQKAELANVERRIAELSGSLATCENIDVEYEQYKIDKAEESKTSSDIEKLKLVIRSKMDKLKKLEEHKYDPDCSYCVNNVFVKDAIATKQDLDNERNRATAIVTLYNGIKQKVEKHGDIEVRYKECQRSNTEKTTLEKARSSFNNTILKLENALNDLQNKLKLVTDNIDIFYKNKDIIENNNKLLAEITDCKNSVKRVESDIKNTNNDLFKASTEKGKLELQYKNTTDQLKKVKELESTYETYKLYTSVISRDGIPYEVITKTLPEIEKEVNNILHQIVEFTVTLQTDGKNIMSNIVYEDRRWALEMGSGMEKFISGLAIRVALINISNLPRPNIICIDEGFGCADSDHLGQMGALFTYLKHQFDFIWIISHLDQMRDMVDMHLEIKKENGYSKISFR
jgi:DNA repair exonuclease SbcCD ATPase subunit